MQINNYKQKAADYAKHSRAEGTLSLAYKEFGRIFEKYLTSNGNKALDFGTGVGRSRNYLEEVGFDADGVDIDESMLNKAKELDPKNKNKYKLINNKIVPQRASYYDLIFSSLVILEMESREEIAHYFREALRVMKFDGTFIALTVNDDFYQHPWVSIDTSYPGNKEAQSGDRVRIKIKEINMELDDFCWTKQDLRAIAIESGFTILEEVEPKAPSYEQAEWISECEYSPYVIFVMKKTESLRTQQSLSNQLGLTIHIPGRGCFVETFRSTTIISQAELPLGYSGDRNASATICLLMMPGDFWPFHKLKSIEKFKHLAGNDLKIHYIDNKGKYKQVYLGIEQEKAVKQITIPANCWYAEEFVGNGGYTLIEATTNPAFHPDDVTEATADELYSLVGKDNVEIISAIKKLTF